MRLIMEPLRRPVMKTSFAILISLSLLTSLRSQASEHAGVLKMFSGSAGYSTCAILADHKVQCWGFNFSGVQELAIANERIVSVGFGLSFFCALTADRRVFCGGANDLGQ